MHDASYVPQGCRAQGQKVLSTWQIGDTIVDPGGHRGAKIDSSSFPVTAWYCTTLSLSSVSSNIFLQVAQYSFGLVILLAILSSTQQFSIGCVRLILHCPTARNTYDYTDPSNKSQERATDLAASILYYCENSG
ncbi:hypothetical protein JAAARDRAFT_478003 [Jaapia argillacea MUCL 33604]|uniref:Uncharacterized protein n=1 Tax=Jaapia argillacea MUCL 33604 TaxID=933084 RepID=A0A067PQA9_9AGAM|nr:hypothetical protein JAAARDRAFT_478003 [Jaapia argillacea MUCL 33604]